MEADENVAKGGCSGVQVPGPDQELQMFDIVAADAVMLEREDTRGPLTEFAAPDSAVEKLSSDVMTSPTPVADSEKVIIPKTKTPAVIKV